MLLQKFRRIFKDFIGRCSHCVVNSGNITSGAFEHTLGDPKLLGLLGEESPLWHSVSLDILGPFILRQFKDARGKHSSYKSSGLVATDLGSGLTEVVLMNGQTKDDVTRAICMLANRHRLPTRVICDAGPQLKCLVGNPLFDACLSTGIILEPVAAGHQFLNYCERQIQVLKNLLTSLNTFKDRSVFDQSDTMVSLNEKLMVYYKAMSLRPILTKHEDGSEVTVIAAQLAQPMLTRLDVERLMHNLLQGKENIQNELTLALLNYNQEILDTFHKLLLGYLQDSSIYYKDTRTGHVNKQAGGSGLLPEPGDFCVYKDSAGRDLV